ncbi:TetR family transcriptional regulator [Aliiruegeria haliotis]|uniref:TetR family transcriptional regulator n=1 Tax=Aliiruegeria haliotis TaxID=1280846 RepID=A0A2T0RRG3_9RHOB|nr:TetR/AcrR family transcriptional regulator [Aliiruegeria haliotis]PRY23795.1 TetR family transcriptional regulator [Aliiruegeria haliotis]
MNSSTDARRDALRTALTDIAEEQISRAGLSSLKARKLATDAGCSVGAIYNVFDDLTGVVFAVNSRTFACLGETINAALASEKNATAQEMLVIMSRAYLSFATEHETSWRCLFELPVGSEDNVPDWYLKEMNDLFALVSAPLREIYSDLPEEDIQLLARALFSSVHGIVQLGLDRRLSGVPVPQIERMIELVLLNLSSPGGTTSNQNAPGDADLA